MTQYRTVPQQLTIVWLTAMFSLGVFAEEEACRGAQYVHGISHLLPVKYSADFKHFDFTNPDAPKAGIMRVPQMGTYDNYNSVIEKGRLAAGFDITGGLVYDRLYEPSIDEPVARYGRLAESIDVGPDIAWIAFKLRKEAFWHDGKPVTPEDVVFTYETFKEHGSVALKTALEDISHVFAFGDSEICFVRNPEVEINPTLPYTVGIYSILPKHYWETRDITVTTTEPPLGSGPYKLKRGDIGRVIEFERFDDYWGRDIPVNKGRYNFDIIKFDYFKDALWLLFDFKWTNKVLFYDFYNTGISFFQNSPMAHQGLPSEKELELLEPWRDQVPERVFTEPFKHPYSSGVGVQRENLTRAVALFKEVGFEVQDGVMRNIETGEALTLDIIGVSYYAVRQMLSLRQNLRKLGIENKATAPEVSNWLFRSRKGQFDGNTVRLGPSNTPGIQLRNWFGSEAAGQDYGQNWMRVRSPVVDSLIDAVNQATTAEDLYAATRALDRVLMWNFYFVPLGSQPGFRLVHWDKFGEVKTDTVSRVPFIDAWWWDEEKARRVEDGIAQLRAAE